MTHRWCSQKRLKIRCFELHANRTVSSATLVLSNTVVLGYTLVMRVAIYARVSRDDGKQDTENQLHELREFCQRSGWTVVHEYIDRASGKSSDRPQFKRLFQDASKRKFHLVLFWALDRFSREGVLETLNHLRDLSTWSVGWRSYTEQFFDSAGPFKDAVISIMASLAKIEREKISDRTKAGLRRARREGKALGRPRVEVDVLKVRGMQQKGLGLRGIAQETGWSLSSIMRALKADRAGVV
jgi:DNA invertase Pin-like site-specific DNA recombinase